MRPVLVIEDLESATAPLEPHLAEAGLPCRTVGLEQWRSERPETPVLILGSMSGAIDLDALLTSIRQSSRQLPVIVVAGPEPASQPGGISAKRALEAGVAGYLPRSSVSTDLVRTVRALLAASDLQENSTCNMFPAICHTIDNNPELVPLVVAQARSRLECWPFRDPMEIVRVTVALNEALDNALYHGNLELSSELRQGDGRAWREESLRRRSELPYSARRIRFEGTFETRAARFIIRDEGTGFDPGNQDDCRKTANLERCSGRGLLLMHMYMEEVDFNETGNQVTLVKHRPLAGTSRTL